jgi:hypothetical protein
LHGNTPVNPGGMKYYYNNRMTYYIYYINYVYYGYYVSVKSHALKKKEKKVPFRSPAFIHSWQI